MATVQVQVSDMLVTVKSREIQRGMLAAMRGDAKAAGRHFLAAGHLELVLASDYEIGGQDDLALRSQLSAASCFWRGGERKRARAMFDGMVRNYASQAAQIQQVATELEQSCA